VICDYFTKWVEAFDIPNMEVLTIARLLDREVLTRFGIPASVHSDQGKEFESKLFLDMCRILDIKKTSTNPYHPQCGELVERFNETLLTMLIYVVDDHQSD
jgi:transposase InsO family protein